MTSRTQHRSRTAWGRLFPAAVILALLIPPAVSARQTSPGAGPVIVLETAKGNIEIETYPEEAPKTVAQIVALVKRNFYTACASTAPSTA